VTLRLVFLPTAEGDLQAIYNLIAEDSPRAGFSFVEDIRRRCEPLAEFPGMGRSNNGRTFRITFDRKVRVIYRLSSSAALVGRIQYLGQQ
jgi:plasmid stabilization system protein ParE